MQLQGRGRHWTMTRSWLIARLLRWREGAAPITKVKLDSAHSDWLREIPRGSDSRSSETR